jgi:hypothetical protein
MTTPAELDAKAARLREIAGDLRKEATAVTGLLSGVKDLHTDKTWEGPVATFEKDANNLETKAGDQRREEKEKEEKEKGPK